MRKMVIVINEEKGVLYLERGHDAKGVRRKRRPSECPPLKRRNST
jgi:hypothetical protein